MRDKLFKLHFNHLQKVGILAVNKLSKNRPMENECNIINNSWQMTSHLCFQVNLYVIHNPLICKTEYLSF